MAAIAEKVAEEDKEVQAAELADLPMDIIYEIGAFLPFAEFVKLFRSCKKFNENQELYSGRSYTHLKKELTKLVKLKLLPKGSSQCDLTLTNIVKKSKLSKIFFSNDLAIDWITENMAQVLNHCIFLEKLFDLVTFDQPLLNAALLEAVRFKSPEVCELILSHGADVNCISDFGFNLFVHACYDSDLTKIKILVDNGAQVNFVDLENANGLLIAISRGCSVELFEYLVEAGSSISFIESEDSWSCLHYAASMGTYRIYLRLLDLGIDSSLQNSNEDTAIEVALSERQASSYHELSPADLLLKEREVVQYLLDNPEY